MAGEGGGGLGADVADAEGGEELLEGRGFGGLDRLDEIGGRELSKAVQPFEVGGGEAVEIGDAFHETGVNQSGDIFLAEAVNVEGGFGGVVFKGALQDEVGV